MRSAHISRSRSKRRLLCWPENKTKKKNRNFGRFHIHNNQASHANNTKMDFNSVVLTKLHTKKPASHTQTHISSELIDGFFYQIDILLTFFTLNRTNLHFPLYLHHDTLIAINRHLCNHKSNLKMFRDSPCTCGSIKFCFRIWVSEHDEMFK